MEYCEHPDATAIMKAGYKGYQGQDPNKACVVFLGLDANWPCCLVRNLDILWKEVQDYLKNPVDY
jgi:hypothetical protein